MGFDTVGEWNEAVQTYSANTDVNFLGSYEFNYWPYYSWLLARVGDGSNYQILDMDLTAAPPILATRAFLERPGYADGYMHQFFTTPGVPTVGPIFDDDVMWVYTSHQLEGRTGALRAFAVNPQSRYVEEIFRDPVAKTPIWTQTEPSTTPDYQDYTLVRCSAGVVLFKAPGEDFKTYTLTYTDSTQSYSFGVETPIAAQPFPDKELAFLKQSREEADNYAEGTVPPIYAFWSSADGANLYIGEVTCTASTLTLEGTPVTLDPVAQISHEAEHFDAGVWKVAMLSKVDCANLGDPMDIINPSVRFYDFTTDETICMDLPDTDEGDAAWSTI